MTKHLPRLDSIRGIAALMVGGFHSCLFRSPTPVGQELIRLLQFFFDGRTGVSIFFVLSGLVLGLSLRRDGSVTVASSGHFLFRRFFRIWPAYAATTVFYLLFYFLLKSRVKEGLPIGHGWNDFLATRLLSWGAMAKNFFFLDQTLNIATWTLKVEMEAAFALPLMHVYSRYFRVRGWIALLLALVILSLWPGIKATRANLFLFYLGYLIPPMLEAWRSSRLAAQLQTGWLLALSVGTLALAHALPGNVGLVAAGIGATLLLILLQLDSVHPFFYLLDLRLVRFLGMVSYSFYLVNLLSVDFVQRLVFLTMGLRPGQTLGGWFVEFVLASLLGMGLAAASFYLVERPGIKIGGALWPTRPRGASPGQILAEA